MASNFAGSYQQYKSDTNVFITWLTKTAIACEYCTTSDSPFKLSRPSYLISENSKIKGILTHQIPNEEALREAKNPLQRSHEARLGGGSTGVATWELLRQAEVIVACGKVRIPRVVVRGLERAIRLRKRCAAWCRMLGTEDKISDERHLYFIEVLEKVLEVLKSGLEIVDSYGMNNEKSNVLKNEALNFERGNRFASLEVEDIEDVLEGDSTSFVSLFNKLSNLRN